MTREGRDGQFLPDLGTQLKVFGDLIEVVFELVNSRRPVEGRIVADGLEKWFAVVEILAVFA